MVSLNIFSASSADPLHQQPLKQQVLLRVSSPPFRYLHLPQQSNAPFLIRNGTRPHVHVLDTVRPQILEIPLVLPSEPPSPSPLQEAFLQKLAFHEKHRKPSDKPTDPSGRAIAHCLRDVQQVSDVDAYLRGIELDPHAFTTAIQKLGQWKMVDKAFLLFQWLRIQPHPDQKPSVFHFSSLLSAMKACRDFFHFEFVMDEMRRQCIEPNIVLYNIIIECYQQQGCHPDAMSYFLELVRKGLIPAESTFKALFWNTEKSSNVYQALSIFLTTKNTLLKFGMHNAVEGLQEFVSEFFVRVISVVLLENKGPDYILRFFEMAEQSTLELTGSYYNQILWGCQSGHTSCMVAKYVIKQRWKISPPLDASLCNHVMQLMGKEKKWWAALEVFERMREEGPSPNGASYTIIRTIFNFLLKASQERGTCRWNVQLLEKMEAHGINPDQYAWDTTLVACSLRVDPDLAVYVFERMIEKGHQPNVLSYGALLSTLEKGGLYDRAEQVWNHMKRMKVKPNIRAFTIMISVYGCSQKFQELTQLLNEMLAAKVNWTLVTYNALITVCAKSNNGEDALQWMQKMVANGFEPDSTSYNQLVIALSNGGQAELAKNMYIKSTELGLDVSGTAVSCLIQACNSCNVPLPYKLVSELKEPSSMEMEIFRDEGKPG